MGEPEKDLKTEMWTVGLRDSSEKDGRQQDNAEPDEEKCSVKCTPAAATRQAKS